MLRFVRLTSWVLGLLFCAQVAAGPVIITGTDAEDHGNATTSANQDAWLLMQRMFEAVAGHVTNGQKRLICIGCNGQAALSAFASAFDKSALPGLGWSRGQANAVGDITALLADTSTVGVIYMPSDRLNALGGISEAQIDAVNGSAAQLAAFVSKGGGLIAQTQAGVPNGFNWLTSQISGLQSATANIPQDASLALSAAMTSQFPAVQQAEANSLNLWHSYFGGNLGALQPLATGSIDTAGGLNGGDRAKALVTVPVMIGGANVLLANAIPRGAEAQAVPIDSVWMLAMACLLLFATGVAFLKRQRVR